jgi:Lon-like ATP-dependent protease
MQKVDWQLVCPQYEEFQTLFEQGATLDHRSYMDLQTRVTKTLNYFFSDHCSASILVIKSSDNKAYRQLIANYVDEYVESIKKPSIISESLDANTLYDTYSYREKLSYAPGLISKANKSCLIIPLNLALASAKSWADLKSAALGGNIPSLPVSANHANVDAKAFQSEFKLILVGDREQTAELDYFDEDFRSGAMLYSEFEMDLKLTKHSAAEYIGFINSLNQQWNLKPLSQDGFVKLFQVGAREAEDKQYMPLSLQWHSAILNAANNHASGEAVTASNIEQARADKQFRESYLPQRAIEDILEGQVHIETQGEQVGQVNGLTVIDMPGHPQSYGEPARISCVIHFGDGDISDVERKAELGGNIHAKGMMIMQAFVSSELDLDMPLPYSASIVFEQSYCEVDGDSASLAELCSLVSALSGYPINQQIAVTGAVDQFGRVQAVGGLNEKIEGFYEVCRHQGFTGKQGVVLPKTNLQHLALDNNVVNSIKNGEFHIWAVTTVDEVIPLLMNKPFRGEDENSVLNKIAERIENFEKHEHPETLLERVKNWFV